MTRYGPGPSFVMIGSVVCSISITGGRARRGGPIGGIGRDFRRAIHRVPAILPSAEPVCEMSRTGCLHLDGLIDGRELGGRGIVLGKGSMDEAVNL